MSLLSIFLQVSFLVSLLSSYYYLSLLPHCHLQLLYHSFFFFFVSFRIQEYRQEVHDVLPEQQQNAEFITATGAKTHQL